METAAGQGGGQVARWRGREAPDSTRYRVSYTESVPPGPPLPGRAAGLGPVQQGGRDPASLTASKTSAGEL